MLNERSEAFKEALHTMAVASGSQLMLTTFRSSTRHCKQKAWRRLAGHAERRNFNHKVTHLKLKLVVPVEASDRDSTA